MLERRINIWDLSDEQGVKAITTNSVVTDAGKLIMGAGIAKQAAARYPDLPKLLGDMVTTYGNIPFYVEEHNIITFPSKYDWKASSPLRLIEQSAKLLLMRMKEHGIEHVFLPRPGCSNGGRDWKKEVKPILAPILPDTVTVVYL